VEVIILVVVLLTVVAIVLTLLPRMRESGSLVECKLQLKLIGDALQQYHEKSGRLPASRIAPGYGTWAVQIAPYFNLKGRNPLQPWDLKLPYFDQPEAVRQAHLPMFLCPARQRERPSLLSTSGDVRKGIEYPGAVGDYACASGDGNPKFPWDGPDANGAIIPAVYVLDPDGKRVKDWQSRTSFSSLERGQSYTILLGEKHVPLGRFGDAAQGDGALYNGDRLASAARVGGPGFGLAQQFSDPFNRNFGSYHPGVCQFLMADNSVQPRANTVSEQFLGTLINRFDLEKKGK
jgi:hypothetical protein